MIANLRNQEYSLFVMVGFATSHVKEENENILILICV